jgi:hypothetical protein
MNPILTKLMNRINATIPREQDVRTAMEKQLGRIKNRTLAGRDVDGFPFSPKKDGSQSTLNRTGLLLRSLQVSAGSSESGLVGRISVTGRARQYAPYVNARRRFLGTSTSEKKDVIDDLRRAIHERRSEQ